MVVVDAIDMVEMECQWLASPLVDTALHARVWPSLGAKALGQLGT
jgi:hypothetical protein